MLFQAFRYILKISCRRCGGELTEREAKARSAGVQYSTSIHVPVNYFIVGI